MGEWNSGQVFEEKSERFEAEWIASTDSVGIVGVLVFVQSDLRSDLGSYARRTNAPSGTAPRTYIKPCQPARRAVLERGLRAEKRAGLWKSVGR